MPKPKLQLSEIQFFEMVSDPVKFYQFFWGQIYDDFELYPEQVLMTADRSSDKVYCSGRDTGKTSGIVHDILFSIIHEPKKKGVVAAPNMVHLKPVFSELLRIIKNIPFFERFLNKAHCSPAEYEIIFNNDFVLYGRIAGLTGGTNFYGLHVDFFWGEEQSLFQKEDVQNVQGCFNKGCKILIAGVPNDVRDTYLWIADHDPAFSKHHVPSYANPKFDKKKRDRSLKIYGGENSPMYINHILGRWGEPKFSSFDLRDVAKCMVAALEDRTFNISKDRYSEFYIDEIIYSIPIPYGEDVYVGMDVGYYPDPSIIGLFRIEGRVGKLFARLRLIGVTPEQQCFILKRICDVFNPVCFAIDAGNIGKSIILTLQEGKDFANEEIRNKVLPVQFGGKVVVDKRPDGAELKQWTKFFSTQLLKEAFANQTIQLPLCPEIENEIQSLVESRNKAGDFIYSGIEHNLTALRCFVLSRYLSEHSLLNFRMQEIPVTSPAWAMSNF